VVADGAYVEDRPKGDELVDAVKLVTIVILFIILAVVFVGAVSDLSDVSTTGRTAFEHLTSAGEYPGGGSAEYAPTWVLTSMMPAMFGYLVPWSLIKTVMAGILALVLSVYLVKIVRAILGG